MTSDQNGDGRMSSWTLETIYGSVRPAQVPDDWNRRIDEAKREHLLGETLTDIRAEDAEP